MRQRRGQRETVRLALDAARWGFARNIEPVEGLSVVYGAAGSPHGGGRGCSAPPPPTWRCPGSRGGWRTTDGSRNGPGPSPSDSSVHPLIAYAIATWGYLRVGEWDDDAPQVFWARRLRFAGLIWAVPVVDVHRHHVRQLQLRGVGLAYHVPLALWTSWSALRLVWEYGGAVIPLMGERR